MKYILEECISEVVPEIHFVALLKLKAPACIISVESTLALNLWCPRTWHTPSPVQSHP